MLPIVFSACGGEDEPDRRAVVEIDDGIIWTDAPKCFVQEYIEVTGLPAEPKSVVRESDVWVERWKHI